MKKYAVFFLLVAAIVAVFVTRALLASRIAAPRTFEIFDTLTAAGALLVLLKNHRSLRRSDWVTALFLGAVVGAGMLFATLFSPYPFFGVVRSNAGQAWLRGIVTFIAALGGLSIMRQGGPVPFHAADGNWREMRRGVLLGLGIGLPLAVVNGFALRFTQGQPIQWQNPSAALLDALQPGIVEEVIYRFALWGLLWLILRNSLPEKAVWLSGLLAMLAHNYSHFDDLFLQSPLAALGMGVALALLWGLPPLLLARRRGLESAIAFHWIQDAARFLAGF
ncbi:MAG: CPBP family intramembrane metalloprotease [Chloroflexota bacterium]